MHPGFGSLRSYVTGALAIFGFKSLYTKTIYLSWADPERAVPGQRGEHVTSGTRRT